MVDSAALLAFSGRLLIAVIFLASAFAKVIHFETTAAYIAQHGLPMAEFFCIVAVLIEVFGGLSLALGYYARLGAVMLAAFLVPVTLAFHWGADQQIQLLKNLAIIGGLLHIAAHGSGPISLDTKA
ncbi:MAG: DoxX family protein [Elusimicrobia bacterium]|nr:DoxX family protein [Elusimicrobiota bacterium]